MTSHENKEYLQSHADQAISPVSINIERSEGNALLTKSAKPVNLIFKLGSCVLFPSEKPVIPWLCYVIMHRKKNKR